MDDIPSLYKLLHTIVQNLCAEWIENCDGGCYTDIVSRKQLKEGPWTFLWQPKKGTLEWSNDEIALMITHANHKVFTKEYFETVFEPVIQQINDEFKRDFVLMSEKTQGRWTAPIKDTSIYEVLNLSPWTLSEDAKRIRCIYRLRGGDYVGGLDCRAFAFGLQSFHGHTTEETPEECRYEIGREYTIEELRAMYSEKTYFDK